MTSVMMAKICFSHSFGYPVIFGMVFSLIFSVIGRAMDYHLWKHACSAHHLYASTMINLLIVLTQAIGSKNSGAWAFLFIYSCIHCQEIAFIFWCWICRQIFLQSLPMFDCASTLFLCSAWSADFRHSQDLTSHSSQLREAFKQSRRSMTDTCLKEGQDNFVWQCRDCC